MSVAARLALKNRIGLHGEVAQAQAKVLARLIEVVTAQSEEHRQAMRGYLDKITQDRARHPDGAPVRISARQGPPPPPIDSEHLPDLLQLMVCYTFSLPLLLDLALPQKCAGTKQH